MTPLLIIERVVDVRGRGRLVIPASLTGEFAVGDSIVLLTSAHGRVPGCVSAIEGRSLMTDPPHTSVEAIGITGPAAEYLAPGLTIRKP